MSGIVFVSGLHADTTADRDRYRRLVERRLPLVLVNGYAPGIDAPFISTDDHEAMTLAVGHLVQLGHRRIGLAVGPDRFVPVQRKAEGFVAALTSMLDVDAAEAAGWVEHSLFSVEGGHAAATSLLSRGANYERSRRPPGQSTRNISRRMLPWLDAFRW